MNTDKLKRILEKLYSNEISVENAFAEIMNLNTIALEFAHLDIHRPIRCGFPEVIFCEGKTTDQIVEIFSKLAETGENVLATRANESTFQAIKENFPNAKYNQLARTISLHQSKSNPSEPAINLICAGTADIPVAEEAKETLIIMNQQVKTFYDIGVAGLHRLIKYIDQIRQANVIIVVAGMEGALPSVVGGLVNIPVIAVPTSVGYGASFNGLTALLGMLNSCTPNVAVVNIDNGFSAGVIASLINNLKATTNTDTQGINTQCSLTIRKEQ